MDITKLELHLKHEVFQSSFTVTDRLWRATRQCVTLIAHILLLLCSNVIYCVKSESSGG